MAQIFVNALEFLVNMGLLDIILPFIIIYMFTFYSLNHSQVFGNADNLEGKEKKKKLEYYKKINTIISFSIAFIFISSVVHSLILLKVISLLALSTIMAFMFVLVFNFSSHKYYERLRNSKLFIFIPLLIITTIFYFALDLFRIIPLNTISDFFFNSAFGILLLFIFGYLLMHDTSQSTPTQTNNNDIIRESANDTITPSLRAQDKNLANSMTSPYNSPYDDDLLFYHPEKKKEGILEKISKKQHDELKKQEENKAQETSQTHGNTNGRTTYSNNH